MEVVRYQLESSIATVAIDDGKVNALSPGVLAALHAALDRAHADRAAVVFTGRPGVWTAGFDLKVLRGGALAAAELVRSGIAFVQRILTSPTPIVIACSGHAIAMGAFLLLAADYRIGAAGAFRLTANEAAIGLAVPRSLLEVARHRLAPPAFHRAMALAEVFTPDDAVAAGWLDRVVPADELAAAAREAAARLAALDPAAHAATKLRSRDVLIRAMRAALEIDTAELAGHTA